MNHFGAVYYMQTYFKFEANEIEKVESLSRYNHLVWRLKKRNDFGITHFVEKYDDVNDCPTYEFGAMDDEGFTVLASGEGDPVPEDKIGCGGVWTEVCLHYPESLLKG